MNIEIYENILKITKIEYTKITKNYDSSRVGENDSDYISITLSKSWCFLIQHSK